MDAHESSLEGDEVAPAVARRRAVEEKLRHDVREMLEVLRADIPGFFTREAKRRFLAAPEWAERLSPDVVSRMKADLKAAGERVASEVVRALEPWDLWAWDPKAAFPAAPTGLDANARVAALIARVGEGLASTLGALGFPDAGTARDSYKLPSYFVAGRFMKSLVESYWRNLSELVELTRLIDESQGRSRRDRLADKWEGA